MALSRTDLLGQISGASGNFGTGTFTTNSFTPPSNSLLVVCVAAIENGGTTSLLTDLTVAGGGLTFTNRVEQGASVTSFSTGVRIWTAPVTSGVSMTLDIDCGTRSIGMYAVSVVAYTSYDTTTPIGATGSTFQDSGFAGPPTPASLTLNAAPAATSEVLGVAGMDKSTAGTTPGSAFTEIHDVNNSDWGGLESEFRGSSTSTTVDWVDLRPGGGALFNYAIVGLEVRAATSSGPDPGVPLLAIQAPGLWAPNGIPVAWAGTEDPAASTVQAALPTGAVGAGSSAATTGTSTASTSPSNSLGAAGVVVDSGTTAVASTPSGAVGVGAATSATATALQASFPAGTTGGSGAQAITGAATVTATPGVSLGAAPTSAPTGTTSVSTSTTIATGAGGATTATATTLQSATPGGAVGASGSQAATGAATVTTSAFAALGTAGQATSSGTSTALAVAGGGLGFGATTTATATTLQGTLPAGCGGAGRSTISAAATVLGTASGISGAGLTTVFTGASTSFALPGGCGANAPITTTGLALFATNGQARALGGTQVVDIQLMSRGQMSPAVRSTSEMQPATRTAAGMYPVDR